jgi:hypothetical protein
MNTLFVLFIIVSGPRGEPVLHSQEFYTMESCQKASELINKSSFENNPIEKGFTTGSGSYIIHSKNAWCVGK